MVAEHSIERIRLYLVICFIHSIECSEESPGSIGQDSG